jgi:PhnB protein
MSKETFGYPLSPVPASIQPELWVGEARAAVAFYEAAFGASTLHLVGHGDDMLLVVDDPPAVVQRALDAGATELAPVAVEHGWQLGRVVDPFGHEWEIGRPVVPRPPKE